MGFSFPEHGFESRWGVLKTEFKRTLFYFLKSFQIPFFSLKVAVVVFFYNENFSLNLSPSAEFIYFI